MREPAFLRKNKEKWLEYEAKLFGKDGEEIDPDRLAELYIQLTDDLAYARTFYPRSQIVRYLNGLAARTHLTIYKDQRQERGRFRTFWTEELPLIFYRNRRYFLYAFIIFSVSAMIGAFGALQDQDFLRMVLGDSYVDMTLDNIERGDPMGVYKDEQPFTMFIRIALNNLFVAFMVFVLGSFFTFGAIFGLPFPPFNFDSGLFFNGIMLGSFLTFFHLEGVLGEALPVIYIHGTLELSAIVIAGAAGFMLGNGFMFPGDQTRRASLQAAARDGIKIMVSLVPVFLMAAFLESFITRLTEMPLIIKLLIILVSLSYILGYYVIYPHYLVRKQANEAIKQASPLSQSLA